MSGNIYILTAILITIIVPFIFLGIGRPRLRPGYLWLLVSVSTFLVWILLLISGANLPIVIQLTEWQPDFLFATSPTLIIDNISWPFAVAMLTISLAALLTDIVKVNELNPQTWPVILALGGVGLVSVIAGNPLTLLFSWVVIDITESIVLFLRTSGSDERERVVIAFSVRIAGIIMLISAMIRAEGLGKTLSFEDIPVEVSGYLLLAAGFRLGVLPPNQPHLKEPQMRRGLGTIIRFVPVAASVILIVRGARAGINGTWWLSFFLIFSAISAILSSIAWFRAENEIQGRPYWILGMSSFALASGAIGLPVASSVWGLGMVLIGAVLFLYSQHHRLFLIILALSAVGLTTLPLTPSWEGSVLFIELPWIFRIVFYVAFGIFIFGYYRFSKRYNGNNNTEIERWMWLVYPAGLALLPITFYALVYIRWFLGFQEITFQDQGWWMGVVGIIFAVTFLVLSKKSITFPIIKLGIGRVFEWVYDVFWWGYRAFGRLLYIITQILEGDGSILWAMLILILLIVTLIQWGGGDRLEL